MKNKQLLKHLIEHKNFCMNKNCLLCGYIDCPKNESKHYSKEGCPSCDSDTKDCIPQGKYDLILKVKQTEASLK